MEERSPGGRGKRDRTSKERIITGRNRKSNEIIQHCIERELKSAGGGEKKVDEVSVRNCDNIIKKHL